MPFTTRQRHLIRGMDGLVELFNKIIAIDVPSLSDWSTTGPMCFNFLKDFFIHGEMSRESWAIDVDLNFDDYSERSENYFTGNTIKFCPEELIATKKMALAFRQSLSDGVVSLFRLHSYKYSSLIGFRAEKYYKCAMDNPGAVSPLSRKRLELALENPVEMLSPSSVSPGMDIKHANPLDVFDADSHTWVCVVGEDAPCAEYLVTTVVQFFKINRLFKEEDAWINVWAIKDIYSRRWEGLLDVVFSILVGFNVEFGDFKRVNICPVCGNLFLQQRVGRAKFCSANCKQKQFQSLSPSHPCRARQNLTFANRNDFQKKHLPFGGSSLSAEVLYVEDCSGCSVVGAKSGKCPVALGKNRDIQERYLAAKIFLLKQNCLKRQDDWLTAMRNSMRVVVPTATTVRLIDCDKCNNFGDRVKGGKCIQLVQQMLGPNSVKIPVKK